MHFSPTDPDARLYRKGNRRGVRLSYLVHDLIDTKSRVILRRKASLGTGPAERDTASEMLDEGLQSLDELGLSQRPEVLTGDAGYGATDLITELMDRGIEPHVPLLADEAPEDVPHWKRRTFDLKRQRKRTRKVKEVQARNRVREIHRTRGNTVSRKLRVRREHVFAEGKNEHGLRRARPRGRERVEHQATLAAVVQNLKRLVAFWALAVWGGVLGSILLLFRKKWAVPVFLVSLVSMVVTSIYNFGFTDGLERMGTVGAIFSPVIFVVTVGLWLHARAMADRGVLR